jgi:metal-sulfur cluster biosynthetic enzyme
MQFNDARKLVQLQTPGGNVQSTERPGSGAPIQGPLDEQMIWNELRTIYDPEIPVNIVDLGLIYSLKILPLEQGGNRIEVDMTLTAPGCPVAGELRATAENKLARLPDVKEARINIVFDPPWHADLMSEAAKLQLGL